MKTRIVSAGLGALLALSATALAQTGVSGAPGVPTGLTTTPDASSSPTPFIPPRPTPHPSPRTSPPPPPAPAPAPPAATPGPAESAGPAAAPAPPPPPPPPPAPEPGGKRSGASFYTPYLSESDVLDRAILDLTAQVRARPDDPGLRNDLGNLLSRRGFAKEARDQYRKAAKLDREFFLADYNEGLLWEKEGKTSPAIRAYERSIKRKPGFPLSRFHLGFLFEKEGRGEAAIEQYAKALRIDPSLRWPARNPLVVQTRLLYRASLANYDRDLADATLAGDSSFADRAVWERLHPQRPVDTAELEPAPEEEEEAAVAVSTGPTSAPLIGGKAAPARPADGRRDQLLNRFRRNRAGRPTPNPSQTVVAPAPPVPVGVPPAAVPAPPPPEDENAPNPAMQEPPPPPVA